ncbi:MAG: hypothetical protein GY820_17310 [Gammaproteobacteria bacterium]|nr:hypothetical protein [Gammaproteobacteria bacterium]
MKKSAWTTFCPVCHRNVGVTRHGMIWGHTHDGKRCKTSQTYIAVIKENGND